MILLVRDIWHKYYSSYFKIVSIAYNNFEISLVVFMPNITTNHAITYPNSPMSAFPYIYNFKNNNKQTKNGSVSFR